MQVKVTFSFLDWRNKMENEKKLLKLVVWLLLVTSHGTAKNEGKLMEKN